MDGIPEHDRPILSNILKVIYFVKNPDSPESTQIEQLNGEYAIVCSYTKHVPFSLSELRTIELVNELMIRECTVASTPQCTKLCVTVRSNMEDWEFTVKEIKLVTSTFKKNGSGEVNAFKRRRQQED